jgi:hypothetical protein
MHIQSPLLKLLFCYIPRIADVYGIVFSAPLEMAKYMSRAASRLAKNKQAYKLCLYENDILGIRIAIGRMK